MTTGLVYGIFFISGASALIFEILWFQLCGLAFGNSVWATSIVVSSFMAGLALGNGITAFKGHKIRCPFRFYAFLEIIIALSGLSIVFLLAKLPMLLAPLFQLFSNQTFLTNSLRAMMAFLMMVVPTTAMGATLPILVKGLFVQKPEFGNILGKLYGMNTFGAMVGIIAAELLLVKHFGIQGAGGFAAFCNLLAALSAWTVSKISAERKTSLSKAKPYNDLFSFSMKEYRLAGASFIAGFSLLALEVIWFRFILLFFFAYSLNFAIMLAVVLTGISLGGLFASRCFSLTPKFHLLLAPAFLVNGILPILLYINFGIFYEFLKTTNTPYLIVYVSIFLMFPVCFLSGTLFTMAGNAFHEERKLAVRASGLLTMSNTIGGAIGSIIAGLIFIPLLGVEKSFFLISILYFSAGLILFDKEKFALLFKSLSINHAIITAAIISLALFPFGLLKHHYLDLSLGPYAEVTNEKRIAYKESVTETIQYLRKDLLGEPHYYRLQTNNYSMSGTQIEALRYMKLFAYWPFAVHSAPQNALLIAFGCGSTAKALTDSKSLKQIDIVDISNDIIDHSAMIYEDSGKNPIHDPRVSVHIEDGRFFLLTTLSKYDLITGEPPPPKANGIVNLYTREYFELAYNRLANGGILTYWLPVYQLKEKETKSIIKGFMDVFDNCSLWSASNLEWMLVGIKNHTQKVTADQFKQLWQDDTIGPELTKIGFDSPEQLGAFFIADRNRLGEWVADSLPLEDNFPKRLSWDDSDWKKHLKSYHEYMNTSMSKANFLQSDMIKSIWPDAMITSSEDYFAVRQTINGMLGEKNMRTTSPLYNLHQAIQHPLLNNFILWAFNSDMIAQNIIAEARLNSELNITLNKKESKSLYTHLSAGAAQKGDYNKAEKYLSLASKYITDQSELGGYYYFRIYLLMQTGQKKYAAQLKDEFLTLLSKQNHHKKIKEVESVWLWINKVFS